MKTNRLLFLQAFFIMFVVSAISQTIAPGDTLKINFQPAVGTQPAPSDAVAPAVPAGYVGDFGLVYSTQGSYTYGWDVDISANARQRSAATGPTYNTIQFQSGTTRLWKITLDPGKYNVKIVAGDYYNIDSKNEFLLNNGMVITDPTPKNSNFDTYYTSITVAADGILSFTGTTLSNNAKVCYIWISRDIAPVATQATSVTGTSFTANWSAVTGASGYKLDVSTVSNFSNTILSESFAGITTSYGNDLGATLNTYLQTPGWTGLKVYDNIGFARLGAGTSEGYIITPTINLSGNGGNAILTFDIKLFGLSGAVYNKNGVTVFHAADGSTFVKVGDFAASSETNYTTQTAIITGGTATSKIKIATTTTADNRIYLDNIIVKQDNNLSGYNNLSVSGTNQAVTGLTAGTGYYFRVRTEDSNVTMSNSNAITTITNIAASTSTSTLPTCPTCDLEVATGGTLMVDATKTLNNIIVNGGAKLTVATGQTLTLTNLTLKSDATNTATYKPEGTGALVVTGTTAVEQYLTYTRNYYVSSPVSNAIAPAGYTYYGRNEPGGIETGWAPVSVGAGLTAGKGYIALPTSAGAPITFTTQNGGTLNTGDINIPLTYTPAATSGKGYNLIGNPYPSHLSWTYEFTQANAATIESSIWYRTKAANGNAGGGWSFVTFNPTSGATVPSIENGGLIPPMQGFWVLAKQTGSIQFTDGMRSHQTGNPLRVKAAQSADRKKLRLQVSNGTRADEALILFDANAADGYDAYDSPKMMNNATDVADIYTVADAKNLVINGLSSLKYNTEIPVGFNTLTAGDFSISISEFSNFEAGTRVFIKDTQNPAADVELTPEMPYHFSAPVTAANANRFSLLFRAPGTSTGIDNETKLHAQVFVNAANNITIVSPEKSNYRLYNSLGIMLENGQTTAKLQTLNRKLQTGLYVVKVNNQSTKIIIK